MIGGVEIQALIAQFYKEYLDYCMLEYEQQGYRLQEFLKHAKMLLS